MTLAEQLATATQREVSNAEALRVARLVSVLEELPGWSQLDGSLVRVEAEAEGSFAAGACNRVAVVVGPIDGRELKLEVWLWADSHITCGRIQGGKTVFQNCAVEARAVILLPWTSTTRRMSSVRGNPWR